VIEEKPSRALLWLWRHYSRRLLSRHFNRVMMYGPGLTPEAKAPTGPTLFLANHSSWWDGVLMFEVLVRRLGRRSLRCMIDLEQVRKHPFFPYLGGFSVDRGSPRDGLRAVHHAGDLLNGGHDVVLFPQGGIRPMDGPLVLERGMERIVKRAAGARVMLMAIRYDFWFEQRPELLVWGEESFAAEELTTGRVREGIMRGMEELRRATMERREGEVQVAGHVRLRDRGLALLRREDR
jgi:1-acyl-sn-glycerol-3-phosphate acyltransferase